MKNNIVSSVFLFVALLLVQIIVLNNVNIDGYITPFVYVLIILLLPYSYNMGTVLILSFLIGLTVDIFSQTGGLHAMACTLLGAIRSKGVTTFFGVSEKDLASFRPLEYRSVKRVAIVTLMFLLIFIHHVVLYVFENLSFTLLLSSFWHALINAIVTVVVCMLILLFVQTKQKGFR